MEFSVPGAFVMDSAKSDVFWRFGCFLEIRMFFLIRMFFQQLGGSSCTYLLKDDFKLFQAGRCVHAHVELEALLITFFAKACHYHIFSADVYYCK